MNRTPLVNRTLLAAIVALGVPFLGTSCRSSHSGDELDIRNIADASPYYAKDSSWNATSVGPRVVYTLTGYRPGQGSTFRDFQWAEKYDINRTLKRHFLNINPTNPAKPFNGDDLRLPAPVSLWPEPLNYFHLSSLVVGGALSGSSAGTFIPIPIDSLIGLVEPGGRAEFARGFSGTDSQSRHTNRVPPAVGDFELAHDQDPEFLEFE